MSSHSNVQSLSAKLAEKQATDRQQIEAMTRSELDALAQSLKKQSNAALSTTLDAIESDLNKRLDGIKKQIEAQTQPLSASLASVKAEAETLQALTFRGWLKPLALSLSLLLGIFIGSLALMQWLSYSITSQLETRATLAQQIEQQQQALAKIEARTWGVELHQAQDGGRLRILPQGVEPSTGWKFGQGRQEQQAVRLGKK